MKQFNTITVLDYTADEVRVFRNISTDNPEEWLECNDPYWDKATCYYMYGKDTIIVEE